VDEPTRASPAGVPRLPERLADGLRDAAANPDNRPSAYVRLIVTGGVHGERYDFEFMADAAGNVQSHLHDELRPRDVRDTPAQAGADRDRFRQLVEAIDVDAIVRADRPTAGFPPDSVVGILEVSDGEQVERFPFLADEAKATRIQAAPPEPLLRAVDAVYSTAAAYLAVDDLKP
jgi:hypothetical protein